MLVFWVGGVDGKGGQELLSTPLVVAVHAAGPCLPCQCLTSRPALPCLPTLQVLHVHIPKKAGAVRPEGRAVQIA